MIAPFADDAGITAVAERIRAAVAEHDVQLGGGRMVPVTLSIGAAVGAGDGDGELLVRHADAALYEAKHGGRDRVVVAPQPQRSD